MVKNIHEQWDYHCTGCIASADRRIAVLPLAAVPEWIEVGARNVCFRTSRFERTQISDAQPLRLRHDLVPFQRDVLLRKRDARLTQPSPTAGVGLVNARADAGVKDCGKHIAGTTSISEPPSAYSKAENIPRPLV
jgi:hypothetical protein